MSIFSEMAAEFEQQIFQPSVRPTKHGQFGSVSNSEYQWRMRLPVNIQAKTSEGEPMSQRPKAIMLIEAAMAPANKIHGIAELLK